jgi:hypothetical protein
VKNRTPLARSTCNQTTSRPWLNDQQNTPTARHITPRTMHLGTVQNCCVAYTARFRSSPVHDTPENSHGHVLLNFDSSA